MDMPTTIINNETDLTVSFNDIPLWTGVQSQSGVKKSFPIALSAHQGPIMQCTPEKIINDVVNSYHADNYQFITPPPGSSDWANSIGQSKIKSVYDLYENCNPPQSILEVGAGSTWVANELYEYYDPDSYVIVDPTIHELSDKVEIIREFFPHSNIGDRKFDLILGFSVLEHVPDPVMFLDNVRNYLSNEGKVILVYPDCEAPLLKGDINILLHEHISYFTEASSRWLASKCGFKVNSLKSENDCFTIELLKCQPGEADKILLNESVILKKSMNNFQRLFCQVKEKIIECLGNGNKVGFHGATNGLNTFLYMSKLSNSPNISIYDGDVLKQGMYLPAYNKPILSPMDDSYSNNTILIISAMSFYDQIYKHAIDDFGFNDDKISPLIGYSK